MAFGWNHKEHKEELFFSFVLFVSFVVQGFYAVCDSLLRCVQMSAKKVKTYTTEYKESAVKLAVESDQPVTDTARGLGVKTNTSHTWISRYHRLAKAV